MHRAGSLFCHASRRNSMRCLGILILIIIAGLFSLAAADDFCPSIKMPVNSREGAASSLTAINGDMNRRTMKPHQTEGFFSNGQRRESITTAATGGWEALELTASSGAADPGGSPPAAAISPMPNKPSSQSGPFSPGNDISCNWRGWAYGQIPVYCWRCEVYADTLRTYCADSKVTRIEKTRVCIACRDGK